MGLNDCPRTTAHHGKVHHQTKGFPIHQVGGGAVVGAGEIFVPLNPLGAPNPEPASRGQGLLLLLHPAQQADLLVIEVAQLFEAAQVALGHLVPAFAAIGGFAAVGAVENRVGGRGCGGKIPSCWSARRCSKSLFSLLFMGFCLGSFWGER